MSQYDELKRLAEAAPEGPWFGPEYAPGTSYVFDVDLGTLLHYESIDTEQDACLRYVAAANPAVVLALIAENDVLTKIFHDAPDLPDTDVEWLEKTRALEAERDQLRAEVAGLRTGYEAYEQVNAELKAEVDRLNEEYDKAWRHDLNDKKNVQALAAEVARLSADSEALRKDAERYRMVRGIASISAGRRHLVVKRLPVNGFGSSTARDFDASIDAALGQGEQS